MTDTTTPTLADLRQAWETVSALCVEIAHEEPAGGHLFPAGHRFHDPGRRVFSADQSRRYEAAKAERLRLLAALSNERTRLRSEAAGL